ncbi:DMT family transporter [Clostridium algidicarnis]|uniref:DMT family transporter n=1 Tax=Clostridium algidicarnis TaxID=37659 RepID=UPI001C0B068C|nr:DMT family transporter [Clostridium algidicarnis]MBU3203934.1 DMT family transporter [Clostridium algidicarnis]MBU3212088.1 DMT family transporter [Clostridium algidicarnis]MBU3221406.1 DMT family transporter [Clostridium algidicarnis]
MRVDKGVILAILSSFTFSIMNVLVKTVSNRIPSNEIAFFRGIIGVILILILMKGTNVKFSKEGKPLLLMRGILGGLYMVTYFFAISKMKLGDASILAHLSGVFVMIFSTIFLKERLPKNAWIFIIIILFGASLIINPFRYSTYSFYAIFGLLSAILSASASITIRKLAKSKKHHSYEIVFYFLAASTIVAAILMRNNFVVPTVEEFVLLFILGVVSLLAQIFLTGAFGNTNAVIVEVVRYIGILFNATWGLVLFGESLSVYSILGGILIIVASIALSRQKSLG